MFAFSADHRDRRQGRARAFDFDALPPAVRERFVASANGRFPPRPVLHVGLPAAPARRGFGAALLAVALLAALLLFRFGALGHARQPHLVVLPMGALALFALLSVTRRRAPVELPYRDGWYVFPASVVRAEGGRLTRWPRELLTLSVSGSQVRARVGARAGFVFDRFDDADAEALVDSLESQPPVSSSGVFDATGDAALYDPLAPVPDVHGARVAPVSVPPPAFGLFPSLGVVAAAFAAAAALHVARDRASDDAAFARACRLDTSLAYQTYLRDGVRHRDEVLALRAPRAELRETLADGSLAALERYASSRPALGRDEVLRARQSLLLGELGAASASLAELAGFERRHPGHSLAPELALARRSLYDAAARRITGAPASSFAPSTRLLVAMLEAARDGRAPIRVRFAGATSDLQGGDALLMASPRFGGNQFLPSAQGPILEAPVVAAPLSALRGRLADALGELVVLAPIDEEAGKDARDAKGAPALELRARVELDGGLLADPTAPALPALRFRFEWSFADAGPPGEAPRVLATSTVRVRKTCLGKATTQRANDAYAALARIALAQAIAALFEPEPAVARDREC